MMSLAGNKHLFVYFFCYTPRLFHLSIENVRVTSPRNGYQSGYSRADTVNDNMNNRLKRFSVGRNYSRKHQILVKYIK